MIENKKYKRILLKISGEALMGEQKLGLDPPTVKKIAQEIKKVHEKEIEVCLVFTETFTFAIVICYVSRKGSLFCI